MKIWNAMKNAGKYMLSLACLVILILFGWSMLTSMVKTFGDYTSAVEPTIVVAIITGLVAIVTNAITKYGERNNEILIKTREKMMPLYEAFIREFLQGKKDDERKKILEKYHSIFAVNSSDDTYQEFIYLQNGAELDLHRFIVALRKEMKISSKQNKRNEKDNKK